MSAQITDGQQIPLHVDWFDRAGQPDTGGSTVWSPDDAGTIIELDRTDGNDVVATAKGLGTVNLSVTHTDVDGAVLKLQPYALTVVGGDAASGVITPGTPSDIPAPADTTATGADAGATGTATDGGTTTDTTTPAAGDTGGTAAPGGDTGTTATP